MATALRSLASLLALSFLLVLAGCGRLRFEDLSPERESQPDAGVEGDPDAGSEPQDGGDDLDASAGLLDGAAANDADRDANTGPFDGAAAFDGAASDADLNGDARTDASVMACAPGLSGARCDQCVRYVDGNASATTADGLSWSSAFPKVIPGASSAYAATQAPGGPATCQVWLRQGRYRVYETIRVDTIPLTPFVPMFGGFSGSERALSERNPALYETILDGANESGSGRAYHVLSATNGGSIDGFTVTSSAPGPEGYGGGLQVYGGMVQVSNTRFVGNDLLPGVNEPGGALTISGGTVRVERSQFVNNRARRGGAIAVSNASLVLRDVSFANNVASERGGAIYSQNAALDFDDVRCNGNTSDQGGAIAHDSSSEVTLTWKRVTVRGSNATGNGGGILVVGPARLAIENLLLAENRGEAQGVAALFDDVRGTLTGVTLAHNETGGSGAALLLGCDPSCDLQNAILWNPGTALQLYAAGPVNVRDSILPNANVGDVRTTHVLGSDPRFVAPPSDLHLAPDSPAIDAANGCAGPELDLEGSGRFDHAGTLNTGTGPVFSDMGVYEVSQDGSSFSSFAGLCP
jgi:predicted outer membrane repeat protein